MWDPDKYLAFADHRGRPFFELLSRVDARSPRRVVDLGCGPGNLTVSLAERWPDTVLEASDSSPDMVAAARERGLDAERQDVRDWTPKPDTDVVVSNATLQWVPEHRELLCRWPTQLTPGAWIAVQVPGNFDAPSHAVVRDLAGSERWSRSLPDLPFREGAVVDEPATYAGLLADAGCAVDAWETTYVQQLTGENPVLEWITGTALRPVKDALSAQDWDRFRTELVPLLDEAYPRRPDGTTFFPFRRIFVVAQVQ
ncbi:MULTISPECIES: trans-aconitate 2-methyltransferase [unclassified Rhodococcus (in: high G+C Gram-positive bacteria)]|uniref:trans-aconitate 2-methyltransferase n=1 Tax=unclassified Rhodococcus (in: high G+C Gram-positive bacteria) TaxID=192944 RepID=UPI00163AA18E|nr:MULTISPECIES: trans-aconitate 2-methyltransferase [unclassified Rhodococcus (in: high G+C Gram-positive bacteria)]MBC2642385.1 trans-aconitate 2-methyltransferase [Rhodococcus sp. 3A]MBC2892872.1 trans-aconitate 2-methyltransferase [Rhodococcus sp. 4CII]